MRTIENVFNVYSFNELSEDAKQKAIDEWRDLGLDYQWWDSVYDDFQNICDIIGIRLQANDDVFFSGFSSQGDGASFRGNYSYKKDCVKNIKSYCNDIELIRITQRLADIQKKYFYKLNVEITQRGMYYHSNTMSFNVEHDDYRYRDVSVVENDIAECMRDLADWLYKQLETEYNWLNSYENIVVDIICNELEFYESGKQYI